MKDYKDYIDEQVDEFVNDLFQTIFQFFSCSGDVTPNQSQKLDNATNDIKTILKECVRDNDKN